MQVSTVGEVVRPDEPILHIVPADAGLVIVAQLEPIHVDQVRPGQDAVLRFSALSGAQHPGVRGERGADFGGCAARRADRAVPGTRSNWPLGPPIEPGEESGVGAWPATVIGTVAGWLPQSAGDWLRDLVTAPFEERPEASVGTGGAAAPDPPSDLALTPRHARGDSYPHRGTRAAELSRQTAHRLLRSLHARRVRALRCSRPRRGCASCTRPKSRGHGRQIGRCSAGLRGAVDDAHDGIADVFRGRNAAAFGRLPDLFPLGIGESDGVLYASGVAPNGLRVAGSGVAMLSCTHDFSLFERRFGRRGAPKFTRMRVCLISRK